MTMAPNRIHGTGERSGAASALGDTPGSVSCWELMGAPSPIAFGVGDGVVEAGLVAVAAPVEGGGDGVLTRIEVGAGIDPPPLPLDPTCAVPASTTPAVMTAAHRTHRTNDHLPPGC
jgi:hypothetical protein